MRDILDEWNPWWSGDHRFEGVPRDCINRVLPWIERREIISITGVRRSGKTVLLYEIISWLIHEKKIEPKNILFIKADDDRVEKTDLINQAIGNFRKWIGPPGRVFVFIDEIQEIKDWQKTLKRIYDLETDVKIFVSGSNAKLLKEELSSLLSGRCAYFEVFPFSFSEFIRARGIPESDRKPAQMQRMLLEYASTGAFPEVVLEKNPCIKKELAGFYFDSIFYRDVIKRKEIRNIEKLERLIKYLLQNISCLTNYSAVARIMGLTTDSVVDYIRALEDAYLLFAINLFEFSYKKQVINPKKVYCVDTGIRNIVGFKFSEDAGRLYENIVFTQLRQEKLEIFYWRGDLECDFIVRNGKKILALQVCSSDLRDRERAGLIAAMEALSIKEGLILTQSYEGEERVNSRKIVYTPLWRWLLERYK